MADPHPKDPGTLAWVIVQKHPSGLPKFCKALAVPPGEFRAAPDIWIRIQADPMAILYFSKAEADGAFQQLPAYAQKGFHIRPLIVYFAVGDTGEGIVDTRGGLT